MNSVNPNPLPTIVISEDYVITLDDYYIGVDSQGPVTITLPTDCKDGTEFVIKSEMKPPLLKRLIKIVTTDGSKIDGYTNHTIQTSNESLRLLHRGDNWWII